VDDTLHTLEKTRVYLKGQVPHQIRTHTVKKRRKNPPIKLNVFETSDEEAVIPGFWVISVRK